MKHATEQTLNSISSFLDEFRDIPGLKEKKLGVFYRKSRAFLHFHEDPAGVFADIRLTGSEFERFPANTRLEQKALVKMAKNIN